MKKITSVIAVTLLGAFSAHAQTSSPLTMQKTMALPGVTGKFDHFAIDEPGNRLFAAAAGNKTVEVIDLATGKSTQSLSGFGKPHGIAWIPDTGRLFVSDGAKAELDVFEGSPFKMVKSIKLSEDADDMVYDSASKMLYVGHGGTDAQNPSAIAVIDANTLAVVTEIPASSHPEGLEIDAAGQRIFANISDDGEVLVIDGKTHAVAAKWPVLPEKGNTPLAYDAADNLLLLGCRKPAKLLVLNGSTGKVVASAPSNTGADDLFYEPATHRAYLITGAGSIDTYTVSPDGKLQALAPTQTVSGAKTGLLVPSQATLYVGIPGTSAPAGIRVYKTGTR